MEKIKIHEETIINTKTNKKIKTLNCIYVSNDYIFVGSHCSILVYDKITKKLLN
jgi:hypothetical protein